jgi:hypothetical protein
MTRHEDAHATDTKDTPSASNQRTRHGTQGLGKGKRKKLPNEPNFARKSLFRIALSN